MRIHVFFLAVSCAALTTAGQILLKAGVSNPAMSLALVTGNLWQFFARAASNPMILSGVILYAASSALWLLVLARADLSYSVPLISLSFIFAVLYAYFVLHETLGLSRLAGMSLIVAGVFLIARS
jgi:drug/metabolite transporter (DMT)-like permease